MTIALTQTGHTLRDGIETYTYGSALTDDELHCITSVDSGPWLIAPANAAAHTDLTLDQARRFIDEIRDLIRTAEKLERARVAGGRELHPSDSAITDEVLAGIGDNGWPEDEAAARFGWSRAKLIHRLRGHSSWTVTDLADIAAGMGADAEDRRRILEHLTSIAIGAAEVTR